MSKPPLAATATAAKTAMPAIRIFFILNLLPLKIFRADLIMSPTSLAEAVGLVNSSNPVTRIRLPGGLLARLFLPSKGHALEGGVGKGEVLLHNQSVKLFAA